MKNWRLEYVQNCSLNLKKPDHGCHRFQTRQKEGIQKSVVLRGMMDIVIKFQDIDNI